MDRVVCDAVSCERVEDTRPDSSVKSLVFCFGFGLQLSWSIAVHDEMSSTKGRYKKATLIIWQIRFECAIDMVAQKYEGVAVKLHQRLTGKIEVEEATVRNSVHMIH